MAVDQPLHRRTQHDARQVVVAEHRRLFERTAGDHHVARGGHDLRAERHRLLPVLHAVNDRVGWISRGAINHIAQRLDVASARQEMQARSYALAMARDFRWLGAVSAGGHFERELDQHFIGPMVQLELPIFDQKQAAIARLEAELQQSKSRLHALSVEARSEVREARGRVVLARELAEHYRTVVIPLRERLVALMQQQYDAMLIGVYQVLMAKQNEVNAYREYIEAVRDYWIARSDLDRAAGGRLVGQGSAPLGTPSPPPPVTPPPPVNPPPPATPPTGAHQHQEHSP